MPTRIPRGLRVHLAALLAVLLAVIDVAAFVHLAHETHVVCAEHGELVHAATHGEAPERDHEATEHCREVAALCDEVSLPSSVDVPIAASTPVLLASAVREAAHAPRAPPYRLAPKTSPPLA